MIPLNTQFADSIFRYFGDSADIQFSLVHPDTGAAFNPTGSLLLFTLKRDPSDADASSLVQKISNVGGITVLNTSTGLVQVTLVTTDWTNVTPNNLYYAEIKAQNISTGEVRTVAFNTLFSKPSVARTFGLAVPTSVINPPGLNVLTVPDLSGNALRILRVNAGETALEWSTAGSGSVTSVALALPNIFSVSGSPVTTIGTLTASLAVQSANLVFAGPASGAATAPTFRSLALTDIPLVGSASGLATLDGTGKLTASQLPDLAVTDYLGSVASQAAMLALTGQKGDWCNRSDLGTVFIITGSDPTQISSWTQLNYPTAPVTSVAGRTEAVTLAQADISGLTTASSPTFTGATLSGATANALAYFNGSKAAGSVILQSNLALTSTGTLDVLSQPLRRTFDRIALMRTSSPYQLRVMQFGDSVGYKQSQFIVTHLEHAYGYAGVILGGSIAATAASGATSSVDNTSSPIGTVYSAPAGGTVTWDASGGQFFCDEIKIYYVKESGAGTFKVQTSSGGAYADESGLTSISAANATKTLGIVTISKPVGKYSVRVVGLSGTVRFIGAGFVAKTSNGVVEVNFNVGGIGLDSINSFDSGMRALLYADFAPDLAFFEMKDSAAIFTAELQNHINYWNTAAPLCDWVYIATTPISVSDSNTVAQNVVMKAVCAANGKFVSDSYADCVDYATMVALGWNGDGTHLSDAAYSYLSSVTMGRMRLLSSAYAAPTLMSDVSSIDPLKVKTPTSTAKLALSNALNTTGETSNATTYDNAQKWKITGDALYLYNWSGSNNGSGQPTFFAHRVQQVGIGSGEYALSFFRNSTAAVPGAETYDSLGVYITQGALVVGRSATAGESGLRVRGDSVNTSRSALQIERGDTGAIAAFIPGNTGALNLNYGIVFPSAGTTSATGIVWNSNNESLYRSASGILRFEAQAPVLQVYSNGNAGAAEATLRLNPAGSGSLQFDVIASPTSGASGFGSGVHFLIAGTRCMTATASSWSILQTTPATTTTSGALQLPGIGMGNGAIFAATLTLSGALAVTGIATFSAAIRGAAAQAISASAIDWAVGNTFSKTLGANTTFTFSNATDGQTITVTLTNTASNWTVTWPTVSWSGGSAPTQTTGAKSDVYTFIKVGSTIYGSAIQNF